MMNKIRHFSILILTLFLFSCSITKKVSDNEEVVTVKILQINDVYEINPLKGGKYGGLARVAYLKSELQKECNNTFAVIAGDFFNPSVSNYLKVDGKRLAGRHMVNVLNEFIDYATFGNHEFDIPEEFVLDRIQESKFQWISSNVKYVKDGKKMPFFKTAGKDTLWFPSHFLHRCTSNLNKVYNLGMFGVTLNSNKKPFVHYQNEVEAAQEAVNQLKNSCFATIGLTHLAISQDKNMAQKVPNSILYIGGHEHSHSYDTVGITRIAKADANAGTAYIHTIKYFPKSGKTTVDSKLVRVDENTPSDPKVKGIVDTWNKIIDSQYTKEGFDTKKVVATLKNSWDATDNITRKQPTEISSAIAQAMFKSSKHQAVASVFNTGSIRVDDVIQGELTEYDILRILPFGGGVIETFMKGSLLEKMLLQGEKNIGQGGYLAYYGIKKNEDKTYSINGKPLLMDEVYNVVLTDFLATGGERNLEFLNLTNPEIIKTEKPNPNDPTDLRNDVRKCFIDFLSKQ